MIPSIKRIATKSILLATFTIGLQACIPTTIGVATVTAVDLVKERRSVGTVIDDNLLELSIRKEIITTAGMGLAAHISVTAINGIVLLTGETNNAEQKQKAEDIAQSFQGASQVVNQLDVIGNSSLTSRASDSIITAKVKAALIRNKQVDSTNIKVVTERATVYLLGIVEPEEEAQAVASAQKVGGVARIVKVFMRSAK